MRIMNKISSIRMKKSQVLSMTPIRPVLLMPRFKRPQPILDALNFHFTCLFLRFDVIDVVCRRKRLNCRITWENATEFFIKTVSRSVPSDSYQISPHAHRLYTNSRNLDKLFKTRRFVSFSARLLKHSKYTVKSNGCASNGLIRYADAYSHA